jgi:uncharacterized DUF497 family protein
MPNFSWTPKKAAENLRNHGVSFETAKGVFDDPFAIDAIDERLERSNVIGMVEDRLLVVTYTLRSGRIHIISARRAEPLERRRYHEERR